MKLGSIRIRPPLSAQGRGIGRPADAHGLPEEATWTIRLMIESITLAPRQDGPGLDALLKGDLARLLVLCVAGFGQTKAPGAFALGGLSLSVVAGTGFEPVTFRL